MLKIAHDYEFPAGNRNDIVNELTTLIRKADECDILKLSIMDLSHPNLKMLLNERDSYKAKAEAFDLMPCICSQLRQEMFNNDPRPLEEIGNHDYDNIICSKCSAIQAAQVKGSDQPKPI